MKTIDKLCDISYVDTTANIEFRPQGADKWRKGITGVRELSLD